MRISDWSSDVCSSDLAPRRSIRPWCRPPRLVWPSLLSSRALWRLQCACRPQHNRRLARQQHAVALREAEVDGAVNLVLARGPHQLIRRLGQREQAVHARMHARETAARPEEHTTEIQSPKSI